MKKVLRRCLFWSLVCCIMGVIALPSHAYGQEGRTKSIPDPRFEQYRDAISKAHGIDIEKFKETMKGGRADGQKITKYDLDQLIMGIKVETEHTTSKIQALEISMDHLEEFPDYYTRLDKMEDEAEEDMKKRGGKK